MAQSHKLHSSELHLLDATCIAGARPHHLHEQAVYAFSKVFGRPLPTAPPRPRCAFNVWPPLSTTVARPVAKSSTTILTNLNTNFTPPRPLTNFAQLVYSPLL